MWREITQEPRALGWLAPCVVCVVGPAEEGSAPAEAGGVGDNPGGSGPVGRGGQGGGVGWV